MIKSRIIVTGATGKTGSVVVTATLLFRGDCEYRGAGPAARSQSLRSCFDGSYDTAAAGASSDILGANILDTTFDCAVSGATSRRNQYR